MMMMMMQIRLKTNIPTYISTREGCHTYRFFENNFLLFKNIILSKYCCC